MKQLIEELKNNQKIKGTECVRIDYMIDRLKDIEKSNNNIVNLIEKRIKTLEDRIDITENEDVLNEYIVRRLELIYLLEDVKDVLKYA